MEEKSIHLHVLPSTWAAKWFTTSSPVVVLLNDIAASQTFRLFVG